MSARLLLIAASALILTACTGEAGPVAPAAPASERSAEAAPRRPGKVQGPASLTHTAVALGDGRYQIDLAITVHQPCERFEVVVRPASGLVLVHDPGAKLFKDLAAGAQQTVRAIVRVTDPAGGELAIDATTHWQKSVRSSALSVRIGEPDPAKAAAPGAIDPATGAAKPPAPAAGPGVPPGTRRDGNLIIAPATPVP